MSSLLAKIRIHPGLEAEFEDVMRRMYQATHATEPEVLRYEYWRGREPGAYYCLLSFRDSVAFWRHQASTHHQGEMERFVRCIADLDLEVIDPVARASPLPPTREQQPPPGTSPAVMEQARRFPVAEASWWRTLRGGHHPAGGTSR
jgi:quinol monooxygenase YgiN